MRKSVFYGGVSLVFAASAVWGVRSYDAAAAAEALPPVAIPSFAKLQRCASEAMQTAQKQNWPAATFDGRELPKQSTLILSAKPTKPSKRRKPVTDDKIILTASEVNGRPQVFLRVVTADPPVTAFYPLTNAQGQFSVPPDMRLKTEQDKAAYHALYLTQRCLGQP